MGVTGDVTMRSRRSWMKVERTKKGQAIPVAPHQLPALAVFRPWGIQQELAAGDLPRAKVSKNRRCATFGA